MEAQARRVPNARGEGERLRQDILDAAMRILEETGREDALSLRAVAREVGISAPSVYLHFKDKTELVSTVLDTAYRALAAAMAEAGAEQDAADPWERLLAVVGVYRRFAVDKPRRYRLMFSLEYEAARRPLLDGSSLRSVLGAWTDAVSSYLIAVAPGSCAEAEVLGIHLWTAFHGQLVLWRTLPGRHRESEAVLAELEESLLRRLLPGPQAH